MTPTSNETASKIIRPFEWLTSPASLEELIQNYVLEQRQGSSSTTAATKSNSDIFDEAASVASSMSALHVGCGSSIVGEFLVREMGFSRVVNVDRDEEIMGQMEERWRDMVAQQPKDGPATLLQLSKMEFVAMDFTKEQLPALYNDSFDLVLDKSTLDCTLCSDIATASMLLQVYRTLKEAGGVYLVISFHERELLLPLLRDLPGAQWTVEHTTMERQVEQLTGSVTASPVATWVSEHDGSPAKHTSAQRKPLNVLVCRRNVEVTRDKKNDSMHVLDFDAVCEHIHRVNDRWFQEQQPLLTEQRIEELERAFGSEGTCDEETSEKKCMKLLSLHQAYHVLFTTAEREHLTFEHFLEDWEAFQQERKKSGSDEDSESVSFETAIDFLKEMQ
jgi:hypothetical protein